MIKGEADTSGLVLDLRGVSARLMSKVTAKAAQVYIDEIVYLRFNSGENKSRFTDLSKNYKPEKKKAVGRIYPILIRHGGFKNSLKNAKASSDANGFIINFNVPGYMEYHRRGEGKLPKREPVDPTVKDLKALLKALQKMKP
jgi:hypothetical protein